MRAKRGAGDYWIGVVEGMLKVEGTSSDGRTTT